jgi:hypothetical protein
LTTLQLHPSATSVATTIWHDWPAGTPRSLATNRPGEGYSIDPPLQVCQTPCNASCTGTVSSTVTDAGAPPLLLNPMLKTTGSPG